MNPAPFSPAGREQQAIVRALTAGRTGVLATLVAVQGSSYRRPGARLLLPADGPRLGSISGGCLEEDVIARAGRVRATGQPEAVVYDTTSENDLVWGVGLGCHGVVRVLLEPIPAAPPWAATLAANFAARRPTTLFIRHDGPDAAQWGTRLAAADADTAATTRSTFVDRIAPPTRLVIFGAGDDAQPLARLAHELGWNVTVADPRPGFATADRFPTVANVVAAPAAELVGRAAPDAATLAVVMTHHYVHDVPLLRELLPRPLAYLGLLGPKQRARRIVDDLAGSGTEVSPAMRERLHAPVGLDIGAESPEQVALAIAAEMQAVLTGRGAQPLRERTRPIHDGPAAMEAGARSHPHVAKS